MPRCHDVTFIFTSSQNLKHRPIVRSNCNIITIHLLSSYSVQRHEVHAGHSCRPRRISLRGKGRKCSSAELQYYTHPLRTIPHVDTLAIAHQHVIGR